MEDRLLMEGQESAQDSKPCLTISSPQAQLYQFAQEQLTKHIYILFNSANHPQLPQQYYALEPEQQYIALLQDLLDGYNEQSIPIMPYLVEIKRDTIAENPFIHWLFSNPDNFNSFFALSSDYDLATVAAHWNNLSLVYNSRQQIVILRLFDARISKIFLPQLARPEQEQLLGPCHCLWFADDPEAATVINNTNCHCYQYPAPWFHLSAHHETELLGNNNRTLRYNLSLYLWENHTQSLSRYSHEMAEQLIDLGLDKAQKLGFTLTSTICQCVALLFEYSPVFYRHQVIQNIWQQAASEYQQILALSEKITPLQWQHITQTAHMDDWQDMPESPITMI